MQMAQEAGEFIGSTTLFLYGPPGVGKTLFAADAPSPFWFDFERSTDTLATSSNPVHRKIPTLRIPLHIKTMTDFLSAVKEVIASPDIKTIVIDSTTRLQRFQMNEFLTVMEGDGAAQLNYTKELIKKSRNHYTAQIQDWGFSTNLLDELFMALDGSGKNIVLIGHAQTEKEEATGLWHTHFDLTPSLAGKVATLVSVIGYLQVKALPGRPPERALMVNPDGKKVAKNRLGLQVPEIKDPSWAKMMTLIKETRND